MSFIVTRGYGCYRKKTKIIKTCGIKAKVRVRDPIATKVRIRQQIIVSITCKEPQ